jgi:hypothetical protein
LPGVRRFACTNLRIEQIHSAGSNPNEDLIDFRFWKRRFRRPKLATWSVNHPNRLAHGDLQLGSRCVIESDKKRIYHFDVRQVRIHFTNFSIPQVQTVAKCSSSVWVPLLAVLCSAKARPD